jgi:hypothetical protein
MAFWRRQVSATQKHAFKLLIHWESTSLIVIIFFSNELIRQNCVVDLKTQQLKTEYSSPARERNHSYPI